MDAFFISIALSLPMFKNKTLAILALVMVINALGFGIIIPLLYPFAKQFGIGPQGIGFLIASFSIAQFIATPILGSLSDRYGRRPVLVLCLLGTAVSFVIFASAVSAAMLFAARILDGITGGSISVAQAVIADSTSKAERAKAFGLLGASFSFGFLVGPAAGGLLSTISIAAPFYFAGGLAALGAIITWFFLGESNKNAGKHVKIPFKIVRISELVNTLKQPVVGILMAAGFLLACAQFCMIVGFQTYNFDVLKLNPKEIGLFFAGFALTGIILQVGGIRLITKLFPSKINVLFVALPIAAIALFAVAFTHTFIPFLCCIIIYGLFIALRDPMINSLLTETSNDDEQGKLLGINQSFLSIGQIVGPLVAGLIASRSVHAIFVASAIFIVAAIIVLSRLSITKRVNSPLIPETIN